eukprot:CCRYP_005172-RD/>CCRYP_005172-RD protein AED:0.04 eAED:0.04 QI:56/1/1/1/0.66/0.75/4/1306/620
MKSSTLFDCPDSRGNTCKHIQILADGTRITEYKESQTLPDGVVVIKTRIARTYPRAEVEDSSSVMKEIKTTITRMYPDGKIGTTTATEEVISFPSETENSSTCLTGTGNSATEMNHLADGSGVLATTSSSKLANGSWSTVTTKVHMNHFDREPDSLETNQRHLARSDISAPHPQTCFDNDAIIPVEFMKHNVSTPCIEVLPPSQPPFPPGHTRPCKFFDNDMRLKPETIKISNPVHKSFPNPPFLETIALDENVVVPTQYALDKSTIPDVKKSHCSPLIGQDKCYSRDDRTYKEKAYSLKSTSSGFKEPARTEAVAHEIGKFKKCASKLECIDCCDVADAAQPVTIMTLKLDDEPWQRDHTKVRILDDSMQRSEDPRETGRMEPATHFSSNNDKIAVAIAIDASREEPIYEATDYSPESNSLIDRSRVRNFLIVALLLVIVSVASVVAVVYSTKKRSQIAQKALQVPTLSPTITRNTIIPQVIERDVVKRNVTLSNIASSYPLSQALNWILHKDEMQLEATDPKLAQRFTLALLGFQFDYLAWSYNYSQTDQSSDWLTSKDECEWFGVTCEGGKISTLNLGKFDASSYSYYSSFIMTSNYHIFNPQHCKSVQHSDWDNSS